MAVYVDSYSQISTQEPLSRKWFEAPVECADGFCQSADASYGDFIPPMTARRMGKLIRRAVAVSLDALKKADIIIPDAIIFGTGFGSIECTERFLSAMLENGETCLQPTNFINSTHNTVASQVATFIKCHGYNNTYSHLGVSFESALLDAVLQFEMGRVRNALVGASDEMTPAFFKLFEKVGYWDAPVSECSVAFVISNTPSSLTKCRILDVGMVHLSHNEEVSPYLADFLRRNEVTADSIDLLITGRDGDARYDSSYDVIVSSLFSSGIAQAHFRHIFGESYTSSAYGLMLGVESASAGLLPGFYRFGELEAKKTDRILVVNNFQSKDWSFILLQK